MQREMPYRIILPEGPFDGKYPVLYLLHGLFGSCDNWLDLTGIADYAAGKHIAIVMPDGGDGWYTDSATIESDKYESYFTSELLPGIEGRFPVSQDRARRGIAGLSMGGYGAFKLALKQPGRYFFAASTSGAFEAPLRTEASEGFDWEVLGPSVTRAFGDRESAARLEGDVFELIAKAARSGKDLPYFYLDCGIEDPFLKVNSMLADALKQYGIRHAYYEKAGGHDWNYWDSRLKRILNVFEDKLLTA